MLETFMATAVSDITPDLAARAAAALESGKVLGFPELHFPLTTVDRDLIAQGDAAGAAKNISYNPASGVLKGSSLAGPARERLVSMMTRFGAFTEALVLAIAPFYQAGLRRGRTSFRPVEIAGRETSQRSNDTLRHVDAFPSTPNHGARILRVFSNVDQAGTPRNWLVGPDFISYAEAFLPSVSGRLLPGAASFMALSGITKSRRSLYDQTMLGLHDAGKRDIAWQVQSPADEIKFLPGQMWMMFTDQTPHAAISGRNALEQTFYVAPEVLAAPEQAPLAVLSRLRGKDMSRLLL
jgi:hypothetical protein